MQEIARVQAESHALAPAGGQADARGLVNAGVVVVHLEAEGGLERAGLVADVEAHLANLAQVEARVAANLELALAEGFELDVEATVSL